MSKIDQLLVFLKENPEDSFIKYALALEYVKQNDVYQACQIFESLTIKDPQYLATYLQYGNLLSELGHNENAAAVYRKGIEIAASQKNMKTMNEIEQALFMLD